MVVVKGNDGSTSGITPFNKYGVWGDSKDNLGIVGTSLNDVAVYAECTYGTGLEAVGDRYGLIGYGIGRAKISSVGVYGTCSPDGTGVYGDNYPLGPPEEIADGIGVFGISKDGVGVNGIGAKRNAIGVYAQCNSPWNTLRSVAYLGAPSVAGDFYDDIYVHGKATIEGGLFQIDHPLDPGNKYLSHSFVNSTDMKNIYDGIAILDIDGKAEVELPEWFETINKDFRYQLTAIGSPGSILYIEEEITKNHFKVAGGKQGMKVSWQVTGIRRDPWANANRVKVEEKPHNERDYYLHPEFYNKSPARSIERARYPGHKERLKKLRDMVEVQKQEKQRLKATENEARGLKKRTEKAPKARKPLKGLSKGRTNS